MNRRRDGFSVKKAGLVLMFGILGGLGCLLACRYPGEWLLARSGLLRLNNHIPGLPYHNEVVKREVTARPIPRRVETTTTTTVRTSAQEVTVTQATSREFARRLRTQGAHSGAIQISLMWKNGNDLDLHVMPPSGETIWYQHKRSACHGWLDVDMNASGPESHSPVENIVWERGDAPHGDYRVYVHHYANHGDSDPTHYKVRVAINGRMRIFAGSTSHGDPQRLVWSFNCGPRGVRPVAAPPPAAVQRQVAPRVTARTERIVRERIERQSSTGAPTRIDARFWHTVLIVALWAAMIAGGLAALLVGGQCAYQRRLIMPFGSLVCSIAGSIAAGFVSGATGQMLYGFFAQAWPGPDACRPFGWAMLGGVLGAGAGMCIPNLRRSASALAGAAGGFVGGLLFEIITRTTPDAAGRNVGTWIVGFMIGLTIAIVVVNYVKPRFCFRLAMETTEVGHATSDHMWRG